MVGGISEAAFGPQMLTSWKSSGQRSAVFQFVSSTKLFLSASFGVFRASVFESTYGRLLLEQHLRCNKGSASASFLETVHYEIRQNQEVKHILTFITDFSNRNLRDLIHTASYQFNYIRSCDHPT